MYLVSILIPTLLERTEQFQKMVNRLYKQINDNTLQTKIEVIYICDNRTIPLSKKRNMMQKMCNGLYFTHLDDDDNFTDNYCMSVVKFIEGMGKPLDIISYNQLAYVKNDKFIVVPSMTHGLNLTPKDIEFDEDMNPLKTLPTFLRYPWQWCLWRTERFRKVYRTDVDKNAREDQNWLKKCSLEYPKNMGYINEILHHYHYEKPEKSTCQSV